MALYPFEELQEINDGYEMTQYLPGHIIIGSDGGDEFYGINPDGKYFQVPALWEEEYITILCGDINNLAEKANAYWKNL